MLSTQSSLGCFLPTKLCFGKCPETSLSLLTSSPRHPEPKNIGFVSSKTRGLCNGYSKCFRKLEPPTSYPEEVDINGLGIVNFFQGKNIFITGATGFLGKVLVEKILRSTPVGKVYVLIKAKDKESAHDRLDKEIINSDLFESVREKHGQSFLREKLIPILGNICEPNLGMDSASADDVRNNADIIVESAASTTFNDRYIDMGGPRKIEYDFLLDINVNAPRRLMSFAKSCTNLKIFAHISTAYVNGRTEGVISEDPLIMRKQEGIDVADEINMAFKLCSDSTDDNVDKNLKGLSQERATYLGWYNAYTLTKAMGEMVLDQTRGDVPVVIIRPTIIESSYKEPLLGWIQGYRMCDPVMISYGKGQLPAVPGNPEAIVDIVPVDMVANTMIAAMAKEGQRSNYIHKPQLSVYHVASSVANPLRLCDFFEYLHEHFSSNPLVETHGVSRVKYFDSVGVDFSRYTLEEIQRGSGVDVITSDDEVMIRKIRIQCKAKVAYAEQLSKMYEFIGFFNARFDTGNTEKLMKEMSREERNEFEVNARIIDWRHYLQNVHIPGLKKHVLNGINTLI